MVLTEEGRSRRCSGHQQSSFSGAGTAKAAKGCFPLVETALESPWREAEDALL